MTQILRLTDELFDQLRRTADERGVSVEQLIARWVSAENAGVSEHSASGEDEELLVTCTRGLLDGSEPPVSVNWEDILSALQSAEPLYPTVEKAMRTLRNRHWSKDSRLDTGSP